LIVKVADREVERVVAVQQEEKEKNKSKLTADWPGKK
jgi:hypothetical protein